MTDINILIKLQSIRLKYSSSSSSGSISYLKIMIFHISFD